MRARNVIYTSAKGKCSCFQVCRQTSRPCDSVTPQSLMSRLLIANTPHNPCRFVDTIGIVLEQVRPGKAIGKSTCPRWNSYRFYAVGRLLRSDSLQWYCPNPEHKDLVIIQKESFHCTDLGTQLKPIITHWMENEEYRRCKECNQVAPPRHTDLSPEGSIKAEEA